MIEFKDGIAEPWSGEHMLNFDERLTQREIAVRARASLAVGAGQSPGIRLINAVKLDNLAELPDLCVACVAAGDSDQSMRKALLHALIEHKDVALAMLLLQSSDGIKRTSSAIVQISDKHTADENLLRAATNGRLPAFMAALDHGASIESKTARGRQPQHLAAYAGSTEILAQLQGMGGLSSARDADGYTVLHCAAEKGAVKTLQALLQLDGTAPHADGHPRTDIDEDLLAARTTGGPFGSGLTPCLLCTASCAAYNEGMSAKAAAFFEGFEVAWELVQQTLEDGTKDLQQRVDALRAFEGADGKGKRLRFYHYVVQSVQEGYGIVDWHADRAALILTRLFIPLLDEVAADRVHTNCNLKGLVKHLVREMRGVVVQVPTKGLPKTGAGTSEGVQSFSAVLKTYADAASSTFQAVLHDAQAKLVKLPKATGAVLEQCSIPEAWKGFVHHINIHGTDTPLHWLADESELADVATIYNVLLSTGVVASAKGLLEWFDEHVLPTIDWAAAQDQTIHKGVTGPARGSKVVLAVCSAAIRLAAYDALLISWAQGRDATFQDKIKGWHANPDNVHKGPLKRIQRVVTKKLQYMVSQGRTPPWRAGSPRQSPEALVDMTSLTHAQVGTRSCRALSPLPRGIAVVAVCVFFCCLFGVWCALLVCLGCCVALPARPS